MPSRRWRFWTFTSRKNREEGRNWRNRQTRTHSEFWRHEKNLFFQLFLEPCRKIKLDERNPWQRPRWLNHDWTAHPYHDWRRSSRLIIKSWNSNRHRLWLPDQRNWVLPLILVRLRKGVGNILCCRLQTAVQINLVPLQPQARRESASLNQSKGWTSWRWILCEVRGVLGGSDQWSPLRLRVINLTTSP